MALMIASGARRAAWSLTRSPAVLARSMTWGAHGHAESAARDHRSLRFLTRTAVFIAVPTVAYWAWTANKSKSPKLTREERRAAKLAKKEAALAEKAAPGAAAAAAAAAAATAATAAAASEQFTRPEPLPSSVPRPDNATAEDHTHPTPAAPETDAAALATAAAAAATVPQAVSPVTLSATYVLVGAGTATASALRAIRKRDPRAQILVIGDEPEAPYMRPPLSKELWFTDDPDVALNLRFKDWNGNEKSLFFESEGSLEPVDGSAQLPEIAEDGKSRTFLLAGHKVTGLDVDKRLLTLDNGQQVQYSKVLLATGGVPRQLSMVKALPAHVRERVTTYRQVADFRALKKDLAGSKHVAVIGGGFLGSELAVALARQTKANADLKVTQIFPEDGNMGLVFPRYLSQWTTGKLRDEGVTVLTNTAVSDIREHVADDGTATGQVALTLNNGGQVVADRVIVAVGIEPNVELARAAGLEIDDVRGGIMVNAELEARSNVYVAGDVTSYHDIALGRRRVEHHDHAVVSGQAAGENMAGAHKPYTHQSMFWSDLGPKIGYEAVGILDSRLTTVGVWAKAKAASDAGATATGTALEGAAADAPAVQSEGPAAPTSDDYGRGAVFYLRNKRVVGVLMWNLFDRVPVARQIINDGKTYDNFSELAKLMRVHD